MALFLFLLVNSACSFRLLAAETDHFSARSKLPQYRTSNVVDDPKSFYETAPDSTERVNQIIESFLLKAVENANLQPSCDKKNILKNIKESFAGDIAKSNIESAIEKDQELLDRSAVFALQHYGSIYSQFGANEGALYGKRSFFVSDRHPCCSGIVNVGGVFLGTDKIDHFFEFGSYYFQFSQLNNDVEGAPKHKWDPIVIKSFDNVFHLMSVNRQFKKLLERSEGSLRDSLEAGYSTELGTHGMTSNGVFSFADLTANYKGLLFFQQIVDGPNPYFKCENDTWTRTTRKFNLAEYVDDAWDESINCNNYSKSAGEIVKAELNRREVALCPSEPAKCKALGEKYKTIENYVLHPSCRLDPDSSPKPITKLPPDAYVPIPKDDSPFPKGAQ